MRTNIARQRNLDVVYTQQILATLAPDWQLPYWALSWLRIQCLNVQLPEWPHLAIASLGPEWPKSAVYYFPFVIAFVLYLPAAHVSTGSSFVMVSKNCIEKVQYKYNVCLLLVYNFSKLIVQ